MSHRGYAPSVIAWHYFCFLSRSVMDVRPLNLNRREPARKAGESEDLRRAEFQRRLRNYEASRTYAPANCQMYFQVLLSLGEGVSDPRL